MLNDLYRRTHDCLMTCAAWVLTMAIFRRLLGEYDAPRLVLPLNRAARLQAGFDAEELDRLEAGAKVPAH